MKIALGTVALALVIAACGSGSRSDDPLLATAYRACVAELGKAIRGGNDTVTKAAEFMTLGSDGKSVSIDGPGQDEEATRVVYSLTAVVCLLQKTGAPSGVSSRMDHTTAMSGTQDEQWGDGMSASWTYHPDNGLDVVFEDHQ